jgi:hypothetical protein
VFALDLILEIATVVRQQTKNFVFATWRIIANRAGKIDRLADPIFMILHHINMGQPEKFARIKEEPEEIRAGSTKILYDL